MCLDMHWYDMYRADMLDVHSISDLIALWPTLADFAHDLGVDYGAAKQMRRRSSISVKHWDKLMRAARRKGVRISADMLVRLHAKVAA